MPTRAWADAVTPFALVILCRCEGGDCQSVRPLLTTQAATTSNSIVVFFSTTRHQGISSKDVAWFLLIHGGFRADPMDVRNLNDNELIDMLSEQTSKLTRLISSTLSREEYKKCKLMINALAAEIRARRNFRPGEPAADRDFLIYE